MGKLLCFCFSAFFAFFAVNSPGQGLTLRDIAFVSALSGSHPPPGGGGGSQPSTPDYYWSMEETGSNVDRIDEVAGVTLTPSQSGEKSDTGLQGLAVRWASCATYNFQGGSGIGYTTGNSLSFSWWMKKVTTVSEDMTRIEINTASDSLHLIQSAATTLDLFFVAGPPDLTPTYTFDTSWHLWSLVYDGSSHILEFFIDEASQGSLGSYTIASEANVDLVLNGICGDEMLIDEFAIWTNHKLTADEITWLINSGAGRQWSDF